MIGADKEPSAPPNPDLEIATASTANIAINSANNGLSPKREKSNKAKIYYPYDACSLGLRTPCLLKSRAKKAVRPSFDHLSNDHMPSVSSAIRG